MSGPAKPRYLQLKELIIGQISAGELQPRDRVPSENELVDATGVSRMTANRALRELGNEGYVERVAGVGTFVADLKAASHVLEVRNIADEIKRRGHEHTATVLVQEKAAADADTARALQIALGDDVYRLELTHYENAIPIQIEQRFVLTEFAPDCLQQDFTRITPSAYFSGISPLQEAEHVVRAVMPDDAIRSSLEMAGDEPCLLVSRRTWAHGRPVTFARLYHPASRFELSGHYVPPGVEAFARAGEQSDE
ncbi:MAG: histidine utilization repressor [Woeseiaceae bacterium]|nr:histidine utilization repressor [Woeseiaceae bacterium]